MFVPLISSPSVIWLITGITKVLKNSISRHDLTIDLRKGYRENNCKENCAKNAWIFFNPVWYLSQAAFRLIVRCYNFLSHLLFWNFHIKIELIFVYLITWFAYISRIYISLNLISFQLRICVSNLFWLHRCWWRMLETKCVGDKFEMLVTDSGCWWPI